MFEVRPVGDDIAAAIDALPGEFFNPFLELRAALEVSPSTIGRPYNPENPEGSRSTTFGPHGRGLLVFAVEDSDRQVVWLWLVTVAPDID